jgi:predicted outer membrane repeat protein
LTAQLVAKGPPKRSSARHLIFIVFALAAPAVQGYDQLYVERTGTDCGDCTRSACATLDYAVLQAGRADTIHLAAGDHSVAFARIEHHITITDDDSSATIVLSGSIVVAAGHALDSRGKFRRVHGLGDVGVRRLAHQRPGSTAALEEVSFGGEYAVPPIENAGTLSVLSSEVLTPYSSVGKLPFIANSGTIGLVDLRFKGFGGDMSLLSNTGFGWLDRVQVTGGQGDEGGAIRNTDGTLVIQRSVFAYNTATWGGAIANQVLRGSPWLSISGSLFYENRSENNGGALSAAGKVEVFRTTFTMNTAQESGGAIYTHGVESAHEGSAGAQVLLWDSDLFSNAAWGTPPASAEERSPSSPPGGWSSTSPRWPRTGPCSPRRSRSTPPQAAM